MYAYIGNNNRVHGYEPHNEYAPDYADKLVALNAETEEEAALEAPPHWVYDPDTGAFREPIKPAPAPELDIEEQIQNKIAELEELVEKYGGEISVETLSRMANVATVQNVDKNVKAIT